MKSLTPLIYLVIPIALKWKLCLMAGDLWSNQHKKILLPRGITYTKVMSNQGFWKKQNPAAPEKIQKIQQVIKCWS